MSFDPAVFISLSLPGQKHDLLLTLYFCLSYNLTTGQSRELIIMMKEIYPPGNVTSNFPGYDEWGVRHLFKRSLVWQKRSY